MVGRKSWAGWVVAWAAFHLPGPAHATDWPVYRFEEGRTAQSPVETAVPPLGLVWSNTLAGQGGSLTSSPCVVGTSLFVGTSSLGRLTAFEARTGQFLGSFTPTLSPTTPPLPGIPPGGFPGPRLDDKVHVSPTVPPGLQRVYYGVGRDVFGVPLDLNPALAWQTPLDEGVRWLGGRVYLESLWSSPVVDQTVSPPELWIGAHKLYKLNANTGAILGKIPLQVGPGLAEDIYHSSPTLVGTAAVVGTAAEDVFVPPAGFLHIWSVDRATMAVNWFFTTLGGVRATIAYDSVRARLLGGSVQGAGAGMLYCLDTAGGLVASVLNGDSHAGPIVDQGNGVVFNESYEFGIGYEVKAHTIPVAGPFGLPNWVTVVPGWSGSIESAPTLVGNAMSGVIYAAADYGPVVGLDAPTGAIVFSYLPASPIEQMNAQPTPANDFLYINSDEGRLYALSRCLSGLNIIPRAAPNCDLLLSWTPSNCSPAISGYRVYRTTTPADPAPPAISPLLPFGTTFYIDDPGNPGLYFYEVCAVDALGATISCSSVIAIQFTGSVFVLDTPIVNPDGSITCHLIPPACPCTTYVVFRSTSPGILGIRIGTTGSPTFFVDPNPVQGVSNCYVAVCEDLSGALFRPQPANQLCVFPTPCSATVDLTATAFCGPVAKLEWMESGSCTLLGFQVFRSTFSGAPLVSPIASQSPWTRTCGGSPSNPVFCYTDLTVAAGATYYYRVCAITTGFPAAPCSPEVTVAVPGFLAGAVIQSVTIVSEPAANSATLFISWTTVGGLCGPPCTVYQVFRTTTSAAPVSTWTPVGFVNLLHPSFFDPAPIPGEQNCYVVTCVNTGQVTSTATLFCAPIPFGGCPQGLTVLAAARGYCPPRVLLEWEEAGTNCTGVAGYAVWRATASGGPGTLVASQSPWPFCVGPPVVLPPLSGTFFCYSDLGLAAGQTYYYTVCALTNAPVSGTCSNEAVAVTPAFVSGTVLVSATLVAEPAANSATVFLNWQFRTDLCGPPCSTYTVFRTTESGQGAVFTVVGSFPPGTTLFVDPSPLPGVVNCYAFDCLNPTDTTTRYCVSMGGGGGCPQGLTVLAVARGFCPPRALLEWEEAGTNCTGVAGYAVWRATASGGPGTLVASQSPWPFCIGTIPPLAGATVFCYSDLGLAAGQTYYYTVCALTTAPVSGSCSNEAVAVTPAFVSGTVLVSATLVAEPAATSATVFLSWQFRTDLCGPPCTTYTVFRTTESGPGAVFTVVGSFPPGTTIFVDLSPIPGEVNCYAFDCVNPTDTTTVFCVPVGSGGGTLPPCPLGLTVMLGAGPTCQGTVSLCWSVTAIGPVCLASISTYQLFRSTIGGAPPSNLLTTLVAVSGQLRTCYLDLAVTRGQIYYYQVCVISPALASPVCSNVVFATPPISTTCTEGDPFGWCSGAQGINRQRFLPGSGPLNNTFGTMFVASGNIGGSAISCGGTLVFGTSKGEVYMLNPNNTIRCQTTVSGSVDFAPLIDACRQTIWVGTSAGLLYAFDTNCNLKSLPCMSNPITLGGAVSAPLMMNRNLNLLATVSMPGNGRCLVEVDSTACATLFTYCYGAANGFATAPLPECGNACSTFFSCAVYVATANGNCKIDCNGNQTAACDSTCVIKEQTLMDCGVVVSLRECAPNTCTVCCRTLAGTVWCRTFTGSSCRGLAVTPSGTGGTCGILVIVDNQLFELNCFTGAIKAVFAAPVPIVTPPIIVGNQVYMGTRQGILMTTFDQSASGFVSSFAAGPSDVIDLSAAQVTNGRQAVTRLYGGFGPNLFILDAQPGPPQNVSATASTTGTTVSWTPPVVSSSGLPIAGYNVYRGSTSTTIGTTPINNGLVTATALLDAAVTTGSSACYVVQAVDTGGNSSGDSQILCVGTLAVQLNLVARMPKTIVSGIPSSLVVSVIDDTGSIETTFGGIVSFTSSDNSAQLPSSYQFTLADAGCHLFSATLFIPGMSTVRVESTSGSLQVSSSTFVNVLPEIEYVQVGTSFPALQPTEMDMTNSSDGWLTGVINSVNDMPLFMKFDGVDWTRTAVAADQCCLYVGKVLSLDGLGSGWMNGSAFNPITSIEQGIRYQLIGNIWQPAQNMDPGMISAGGGALKLIDSTHGWESVIDLSVPSPLYRIFKFNGRGWNLFQTFGDQGLTALSFVRGDPQTGWASGPFQRPWLFSRNRWSEDTSYALPLGIAGMWMNSPTDVWGVGAGPEGSIVHFDGNIWTKSQDPAEALGFSFADVHFIDPDHGVAVGSTFISPNFVPAAIYYVSGRWFWLPLPVKSGYLGSTPFRVRMINEREAWALAGGNVLFHLRIPDPPVACQSTSLFSASLGAEALTPSPILKIQEFEMIPDYLKGTVGIHWQSSIPCDATLMIYPDRSKPCIGRTFSRLQRGTYLIPIEPVAPDQSIVQEYTAILRLSALGETSMSLRKATVIRPRAARVIARAVSTVNATRSR